VDGAHYIGLELEEGLEGTLQCRLAVLIGDYPGDKELGQIALAQPVVGVVQGLDVGVKVNMGFGVVAMGVEVNPAPAQAPENLNPQYHQDHPYQELKKVSYLLRYSNLYEENQDAKEEQGSGMTQPPRLPR